MACSSMLVFSLGSSLLAHGLCLQKHPLMSFMPSSLFLIPADILTMSQGIKMAQANLSQKNWIIIGRSCVGRRLSACEFLKIWYCDSFVCFECVNRGMMSCFSVDNNVTEHDCSCFEPRLRPVLISLQKKLFFKALKDTTNLFCI